MGVGRRLVLGGERHVHINACIWRRGDESASFHSVYYRTAWDEAITTATKVKPRVQFIFQPYPRGLSYLIELKIFYFVDIFISCR